MSATPPPMTTEQMIALIDGRIASAMRGIQVVKAKVDSSYSAGSDIPVQLAEDAAAGPMLFKSVLSYASQPVIAGDDVVVAQLNGSYVILGKIGTPPAPTLGVIPTGSLVHFGSASIPTGWLKCDGSAVSRTTYAGLFAVIGTTYGSGDGSTTFNLPNASGRSLLGVGDSGTAGHTNHTLGTNGGEESHTLITSELASHTHTGPAHTHTYTQPQAISAVYGSGIVQSAVPGSNAGTATGSDGTENTGSAGSSSPHNNMHPFVTANVIIKT
jgi:microcystin-dependent protein